MRGERSSAMFGFDREWVDAQMKPRGGLEECAFAGNQEDLMPYRMVSSLAKSW